MTIHKPQTQPRERNIGQEERALHLANANLYLNLTISIRQRDDGKNITSKPTMFWYILDLYEHIFGNKKITREDMANNIADYLSTPNAREAIFDDLKKVKIESAQLTTHLLAIAYKAIGLKDAPNKARIVGFRRFYPQITTYRDANYKMAANYRAFDKLRSATSATSSQMQQPSHVPLHLSARVTQTELKQTPSPLQTWWMQPDDKTPANKDAKVFLWCNFDRTRAQSYPVPIQRDPNSVSWEAFVDTRKRQCAELISAGVSQDLMQEAKNVRAARMLELVQTSFHPTKQ